eukprot:SAG11_NODE_37140_length_258_cov_0.654088_1_plen_59_part_10
MHHEFGKLPGRDAQCAQCADLGGTTEPLATTAGGTARLIECRTLPQYLARDPQYLGSLE